MFRTYDGKIDWPLIGMLSTILLALTLLFGGIWAATQATDRQMTEKKAYKAKCIDAGGVPTAPFDYVKGHGEGYLCINPSAIIEVE